jgi:hypothetical protein
LTSALTPSCKISNSRHKGARSVGKRGIVANPLYSKRRATHLLKSRRRDLTTSSSVLTSTLRLSYKALASCRTDNGMAFGRTRLLTSARIGWLASTVSLLTAS